MTRLAHFDHAGSAPNPPEVIEAIHRHLLLEQEVGGYQAARMVKAQLDGVYASLAGLLGCATDEVALTPGGSAAWNALFHGVPLQRGDRILTTSWEYGGAVAAMRQRSQRENLAIDVAPPGPDGSVDLAQLQARLTPRTRLVAVTWTPTSAGVEEPVAAIGELLKGRDLFYLVDAAQAVGQRPIDVKAIGCHGLIGASRKFLAGPRGVGFLYLDRNRTDMQPSQIDHWVADPSAPANVLRRPDARRFELWERAPALHLGFGVAVRRALTADLAAVRAESESRADRLRRGLCAIPNVTLSDPHGAKAPIIGLRVRGVDSELLATRLSAWGVSASVSTARSTPLSGRLSGGAILRLSPHACTTRGEIDLVLERLESVARSQA